MSFNQFAVIAVVALAVTIPIVRMIPRARQSPAFDRLLWASTFVIAFLGSWAALGYVSSDSNLAALNHVVVADTPIVTVLAGALGGALFLNVILWIMDRFSQSALDEGELGDEGSDGYPIPPDDDKALAAENATAMEETVEQPQSQDLLR